MSRAGDLIPKFGSATATELPAAGDWVSMLVQRQEPQPKWVTALFVQFCFLQPVRSADAERVLEHYRARLEQVVTTHGGDVVAISSDAGLAVFSGTERSQEHTRNAVGAAGTLIEEAKTLNRQRLAQDLMPLRVGIGLDAGLLATGGCNRHPRLDPGLQIYLDKARRLSELNYQAPFPAIFVSHAVADRLECGERYAIQSLGDVFVERQPDPLAVYAVMDAVLF